MLKETSNSINMCQNSSHGLGDIERKILKDYGLVGRVVALRNTQSEMEEKSGCVHMCFFSSFLKEIQRRILLTLAERAIILQCIKIKDRSLFISIYLVEGTSGHVVCNQE